MLYVALCHLYEISRLWYVPLIKMETQAAYISVE